MQMTIENEQPENVEICRNAKNLKEQSRDDTMPLLKDEGIKNSLPMQLPIPQLDINACRTHLQRILQ